MHNQTKHWADGTHPKSRHHLPTKPTTDAPRPSETQARERLPNPRPSKDRKTHHLTSPKKLPPPPHKNAIHTPRKHQSPPYESTTCQQQEASFITTGEKFVHRQTTSTERATLHENDTPTSSPKQYPPRKGWADRAKPGRLLIRTQSIAKPK